MRLAAAALLAALVPAAALPQEALTDTRAFERAYAESFYRFDACGDEVTGVAYRRALGRRFAACPFAPEARARFERRADAQERRSQDMLKRLVEQHGGMPVKLDGMGRTCREQIESPEYQALRGKLEQGDGAEAAFSAPCDAADEGGQ